ncbi:MAG: plastocyanin [Candidatus Aldehydirespiratoraceae bacterium]
MRRLLALTLLTLALIAAACSSDAEPVADADSAPAPTVAADAEEVVAGMPDEPAFERPDYAAEAAGLAVAASDRELPPVAPEAPIGAYGYSRYVFSQSGDDVVPSLIEGPLGYQTRCQEEAQDCSYQELKALHDSGDDVPNYLGMDRETLGELVDQLDRVNVAISAYADIGDACAAGFAKSTNQVANMGIHMIDNGANGFDPDRPQMVLFAQEDGFGLGSNEIGRCQGDEWTGEPGFVPVGAVFNINLTEDHPDGFAGPIDNWHIHYNTCIGRSEQAGSSVVNDPESTDSAEGARSSTTQQACAERGGRFLPVIPSWMMHAYVAEDFDAQSGVFSMFNPTVWPLSNAEALADDRVVQPSDDVEAAPIINFSFGEINVGVGETVRFSNSDAVPHTVTAGSFLEPDDEFDSGVLGTGQAYDLSFDLPGDYQLFCVLHPDMVGTVTVG